MVVLPKELNETVKCPEKAFTENPAAILDMAAFVCEADYEMTKESFEAAAAAIGGLANVPVKAIREGFEKIITSKNAGKGLQLLARVGAMGYIIGKRAAQNMSKREMSDFYALADNIDKTKPVRLRRLALFYKCLEGKRAEEAVKMLDYSKEDEEALLDGIYLLDKLYFITNKYEMKQFLVKYGMDRYEFLHSLSKAQRIVYDLPVNRIESRNYIMDNIRQFNEPVFLEDLAISPEDALQAGIGEKDIDRVFEALLDLAHIKPDLNNRNDMLAYAKKFGKSRLAAACKKLKFIK